MAFIKGTWVSGEVGISLNVDQIVAVTDYDGRAVVHTNIPSNDGYKQFWLTESYDDIQNKIAAAISSPII